MMPRIGPFTGDVVKIKVSFTRDQLIYDSKPPAPLMHQSTIGGRVMRSLQESGVPLIGVLGIISVAYGVLSVHMIDGLDGDEFVYEWEGVPVPRHLRHYRLTTQFTLADAIADSEEL